MYQSGIDRKSKKNKIGITLLLLILLFSMAFVIVFKTDTFHIKAIEIYGNRELSEQEILNYTGNILGNNIFKIKPSNVQLNLLKHPYIKKVEVKRNFPDKFRVDLVERVEAAVIPFMGSYLVIDGEGVVMKNDQKSTGFNVITGLEFDNFMEGAVLKVKDIEQLNRSLFVAKSLGKINITIREIDVSNKKNMLIKFSDDFLCKIGDGKNIDYKLHVLTQILEDLKAKEVTRGIIDISHEGYPSYRPVE